jgi:hypothetical protein
MTSPHHIVIDNSGELEESVFPYMRRNTATSDA